MIASELPPTLGRILLLELGIFLARVSSSTAFLFSRSGAFRKQTSNGLC